MDIKDVIALIHEVSESKLTSFTYEEDGVRLSFKAERIAKPPKGIPVMPVSGAGFAQPYGMPTPPNMVVTDKPIMQTMISETNNTDVIEEADIEHEENLKVITSPMVGTFYSAGKEGDAPFVAVGDTVKKGQIVGIVEAMKLMNEIESPYDGVVAEILVKDKDMIGFGQNLIKIK